MIALAIALSLLLVALVGTAIFGADLVDWLRGLKK